VTYPDPVHTGAGELSATFRPAGTPRELEYRGGSGARYLATGASTGGLFGLYRWEMGPASGGPGPHFHRAIAESFYVLDGGVQIFDGRDWREAGPGDFVHIPKHVVHREVNAGTTSSQEVITRSGTGPLTVNVDGPAPA
jgi:uncharacterized RmlC-like cupin family protein